MPKDSSDLNPGREYEQIEADVCVIGGGAGGIAVAVAAAGLGKRVVLVEKHKLGGDSLNYGSIPSKALLAAARRAHIMRSAWTHGITPVEPWIDSEALSSYLRDAIDRVGLNCTTERLNGLGIRVITAAARFVGKAIVEAGDARISARRFVIATGSSPEIPKCEGLSEVSFLTNETIFDRAGRASQLIVLGAGGVALELAQSFRRLGCSVVVLEEGRSLPDEDPEMAVVVINRLNQEGIAIREGVRFLRATRQDDHFRLEFENNGETENVEGTDLLVAGARRPNIADLGLDAAGVATGPQGIKVDKHLKTRNRRIYAIGDAIGSRSTTAALDQAMVVVRRAVLGLPGKADPSALPRVTYTDPEIASIGLSEDEARTVHGRIRVLRWPYYENDRAQAEGDTEGHIKVLTDGKGRILGVTLVGANAGEMIAIWSLALSRRLRIEDMLKWMAPYPALAALSTAVAWRSFSMPAGNSISNKIIALLTKLR